MGKPIAARAQNGIPNWQDAEAKVKLRRLLAELEPKETINKHSALILFEDDDIESGGTVKTIVSFGIEPLLDTMDEDSIECATRFDFLEDGRCQLVPAHGGVTLYDDWLVGYAQLLKAAEEACKRFAGHWSGQAAGFSRRRQELGDPFHDRKRAMS
jgi:hypothetical protein